MMSGFAAIVSVHVTAPGLHRICVSIKIQLYFFRIATKAEKQGAFNLSSVFCPLSSVMSDDHSELVPLLPLPNRTVKRLRADDSVDYPCESRSSSDSLQSKNPQVEIWGFLLCGFEIDLLSVLTIRATGACCGKSVNPVTCLSRDWRATVMHTLPRCARIQRIPRTTRLDGIARRVDRRLALGSTIGKLWQVAVGDMYAP